MRGRWSLLIGVVALLAIGMLVPRHDRDRTRSSFGKMGFGHGAVFDLLTELGLPVERNLQPPSAIAPRATAWFIEPVGICDAEPEPEDGWPGRRWIAGGGTAVVLLSPCATPCTALAGQTLPSRTSGQVPARDCLFAGGAPPTSDHPESEPEDTPPADPGHTITGPLVPRPRDMADIGLRHFTDVQDWRVEGSLDDEPFVLSRGVGDGRLVVVGDARVLWNRWLDQGDTAPFVVDLAARFGVPVIDEYTHGFRATQSAALYLARSPAAAVFLGAALLGLLHVSRGNAFPAPQLDAPDTAAPTLNRFVASLARLYATTGDHGRALSRYREVTAGRLRRHFALPPETPLAALVDRLRGLRTISAENLELLEHGTTVRTPGQLERAAQKLDALVTEATR